MSYWACAQTQPSREQFALCTLERLGFETYAPRIRTKRAVPGRGRLLEGSAPLFINYVFILIHSAWYAAHYAPGVTKLLRAGDGHPLHVPDRVISDLRTRERNGLIELPKAPGLQRGDKVQVVAGVLTGLSGIVEGMRPRERVEVLLTLLGTQRRVELARADVRPA
jgi:transcription antitermination factor NusG